MCVCVCTLRELCCSSLFVGEEEAAWEAVPLLAHTEVDLTESLHPREKGARVHLPIQVHGGVVG